MRHANIIFYHKGEDRHKNLCVVENFSTTESGNIIAGYEIGTVEA